MFTGTTALVLASSVLLVNANFIEELLARAANGKEQRVDTEKRNFGDSLHERLAFRDLQNELTNKINKRIEQEHLRNEVDKRIEEQLAFQHLRDHLLKQLREKASSEARANEDSKRTLEEAREQKDTKVEAKGVLSENVAESVSKKSADNMDSRDHMAELISALRAHLKSKMTAETSPREESNALKESKKSEISLETAKKDSLEMRETKELSGRDQLAELLSAMRGTNNIEYKKTAEAAPREQIEEAKKSEMPVETAKKDKLEEKETKELISRDLLVRLLSELRGTVKSDMLASREENNPESLEKKDIASESQQSLAKKATNDNKDVLRENTEKQLTSREEMQQLLKELRMFAERD